MRRCHPPRPARWILERTLPAEVRDEIIGDLHEMFARRQESNGEASARFWYWRQSAFFTLHFVAARFRERSALRRQDAFAGRTRRYALGFLGRDLVHAGRSLAKARAFTFVCAGSLGIGIGTVIAIFALMRVLLGAPPGIAVDGLVELLVLPQGLLRVDTGHWAVDTWSYPDFMDIRDAESGMTIAGWAPHQSLVRQTNGGEARRVETMFVSRNYFRVAGAALTRGPGFEPAPPSFASTARTQEAIVSHRFWQNQMNGDPAVIGRNLVVDGTHFIVVGVASDGFRGHFAHHRPGFDLWLPLEQHPRLHGRGSARFDRDVDWVHLLGRLHPNTSLVQASGVVSAIMAGLAERHPASNKLKAASVEAYSPTGVRRRTDALGEGITVLVLAAMVLLVVCLNISGMVLVRSASRERELAVRLAVGASRARLVQYLLAEAFLLSLLGGALGTAVIFGTPAVLGWWFNASLDEASQLQLDGRVLAVCTGLCVVTSFVFGLLPALRFSRPTVLAALKDESGGGGRRVGRIHRWTAAVQAGIAVPFLVVGGVRLDQTRTAATTSPGFEPRGLFAVPIDLGAVQRAGAPFELATVWNNLEGASGVAAVAAANGLPLDFQSRDTLVTRDGRPESFRAHATRVSPGYVETLGIRLVRGRGITSHDRLGTEPVVIISESLAGRLFPDADPIGARLTFALDRSQSIHFGVPDRSLATAPQSYTVVGVAADLAAAYLEPRPQMFVALAQNPAPRVFVIARSSAGTEAMRSAFVNALRSLDVEPDAIRSGLVTGDGLMRRSIGELAFGSTMAAIAGGAALLLASLGIFGVIGFMVATRTREIGIRIALGASRPQVLRGVLLDAMKLVAGGVVFGVALAYVFVREISWYSLGGVEPLIYLIAVGTTLIVALMASLPAARRAAAVEPLVAMRAE